MEESGYESDSEKEIQPDSKTIFMAQEPSLIGLGDTTTIAKGYDPYNSKKNLGTYGLRNVASVYQHFYPKQEELSKKNTPGGSTRRDDHDSDPTRLCGALARFFHLKQSPDWHAR